VIFEYVFGVSLKQKTPDIAEGYVKGLAN